MAPVVHGLEREYDGRVDFLYLNIAEARNDSARLALGFRSTPHFFFVDASGAPRESFRGVVPADSVRGALDRLLGAGESRR